MFILAKIQKETVYYTIHTRHEKFEGGESLDDLARRADQAIDATIWPHVVEALQPRLALMSENERRPEDAHVVLVSHGLTISELVAAREFLLDLTFLSGVVILTHAWTIVLHRSPECHTSGVHGSKSFKGLPNTGWTQVLIDIQPVTNAETDSDTQTPESEAPAMVDMELRSIHIHSVNNAPHLAHVVRGVRLPLFETCYLTVTSFSLCRGGRRAGSVVRRMMRNSAEYASSLREVARMGTALMASIRLRHSDILIGS